MTDGVTLRQLSERSVAELRGVGPRKLVALHEVGVDSILDLLTTYPRRWVDRTERGPGHATSCRARRRWCWSPCGR